MSYVLDITVPRTGEPLDSARLVNWVVQPGEDFGKGDILLEIENDKSVIEVPAMQPGTMLEHLVAVDGLVDSDTPLARIRVEGEAPAAAEVEEARTSTAPKAVGVIAEVPTTQESVDREPFAQRRPEGRAPMKRLFATPVARALSRELGIGIESITGSGPDGRVTRLDVEKTAARRRPSAGASNAIDGGTGAKSSRARMTESALATSHGATWTSVWEPLGVPIEGPTVVLIHGLFGDRNTWAGCAHTLGRAGLRVLAMDLPCHGRSESVSTDVPDIVDAVAEIIDRICLGPVALVGHSFGGAIATELVRRPNLVIESLTLIAPVGMGTQIQQQFIDGMLYADTNEAMTRELAKLTVEGITPSPAYVDELLVTIRDRRDRLPELCRRVSWNGVQQIDVSQDFERMQCPVVLIHGRRDEIIPWEHALNAPARVALHLLAEAGHMPQWEAPALIADILLERIRR